MKKVLITILLTAFVAVMAVAQPPKFKGISMEGTAKAFAEELEKKGDKLFAHTSDCYYLYGTYSNYGDCIIMITEDGKGNVNTASALLRETHQYEAVYRYYLDIKKKLTEEYGIPELWIHNEQKKQIPSDDDRLETIIERGYDYVCRWELPEGSVQLLNDERHEPKHNRCYRALL